MQIYANITENLPEVYTQVVHEGWLWQTDGQKHSGAR
jgi:hypothetical protein